MLSSILSSIEDKKRKGAKTRDRSIDRTSVLLDLGLDPGADSIIERFQERSLLLDRCWFRVDDRVLRRRRARDRRNGRNGHGHRFCDAHFLNRSWLFIYFIERGSFTIIVRLCM